MSKGNRSKVERDELDVDLDALFKLPLAEFTDARNALAARLKKSGRGDDAARVKALAKAPVSAWAVNQLYWNHREAFDQLLASGERFHKAQTSAAKAGDLRGALDARREALTRLSDLAESVLEAAGHSPSLDTIRRITSTLEAMSVYASRSDAPSPGRLTEDVDPPGFDSLAGWVPAGGMSAAKPSRVATAATAKLPRPTTPAKSRPATTASRKPAPDDRVRKLEEVRKAKIAAAKVSLQEAKRSLTAARTRAQSLEATKKKADADAKKAEKQRQEAEESLRKAKAAAEAATRHARKVALEIDEAVSAVDDAKRTVENKSRELESLVRESSAR
ncbi:MAG TPA: hypothetical protein VMS31_13670 [Pyrinomonadaceae bacterium]|nr:hypothetical protein [Pyrinomonadaceae bacterium]